MPQFPEGSKISIKSPDIFTPIAVCRRKKSPRNILMTLTLADVFAGLSHYLQDRERIDAEIKGEVAFNLRDSLTQSLMTLPQVSLKSLATFEDA